MQNQNVEPTPSEFGINPDDITARDQAFARMFRPDELVWLTNERYDPEEVVWRMDFLRQAQQGVWMSQRYHYDVATGVIYFMGARPVDEDELIRLRRQRKPFIRP
jgi:hypothetical protein